MSDGSAKIIDSAQPVEMIVDGPCLAGTLHQLEIGVAAKPMTRQALVKVQADAINLLEKVLSSYVSEVAPGEVGSGGTAVASTATVKRPPTGLLYGRVQSGKTVAMIAFCAAAIDNGFRVIVVLTSDFVKLVEQTADRFTALDGPLIKNALLSDSWNDDSEHVRSQIGKHGIVFICTKNKARLASLVDFLHEVGAAGFPALVLDDEADQATLDTTVGARSSGRAKVPLQSSTIYRKAVEDDEGQSIRQTLRHHVFLQVTATPYALLLQNVDNPLRPTFTHLLEPGDGYTGGEEFFDVKHVEGGEPPLVSIDEGESAEIDACDADSPPIGLQQALAFFVVAAAAQNLLDPSSISLGQNFLCHTSQKTADHARLATLIRNYLNRLNVDLESGDETRETIMRLHWAHTELKRTLPNAPEMGEILARVRKRLPRREVPVVNSSQSPVEFGRQLNFIVGGNILGRGLTIDNLLVTYYLRRAKVSQMDTVLQHARMFGYRRPIMPFTRVFVPDALGARFHFIHIAERNLRRQLAGNAGRGRLTVETMSQLRATRLNVLDAQNLAAYEPGHHIYPSEAGVAKKDLEREGEIEIAVRKAFGGSLRESTFTPVSTQCAAELLRKIPYGELANMWDPQMLTTLLERLSSRYSDRVFIFYRTMNRSKTSLPTGALSGDELDQARAQPAPVLCVFRDDGRKLKGANAGRPFWYPSLVLPSDMATQLFNTSS